MSKTLRFEALIKLEQELRSKLENVSAMLKAVEDSRIQFDSAAELMSHSSDEMKGQLRILKERQTWLMSEQDTLKDELKKLTSEIMKRTHP